MMKLTNTPIERFFKVRVWKKGYGWATVGITECRWKAEQAVEMLRKDGKMAEVIEIEEDK